VSVLQEADLGLCANWGLNQGVRASGLDGEKKKKSLSKKM